MTAICLGLDRTSWARQVDRHTEVLTFLSTDTVGSTRRWTASAEALAADLDRHDVLVSGVIGEHGGTVSRWWERRSMPPFRILPLQFGRRTIDRRLPHERW